MKTIIDRIREYTGLSFEQCRLGNPCITKREAIDLADYIASLENKIDISFPMSTRDYFAAKALQGFVAKTPYIEHPDAKDASIYHSYIARSAYSYADAMLKEMEK